MRGGPCTLADKQVRPTPNNNSSTADKVTECLVLATRPNLMIGSKLKRNGQSFGGKELPLLSREMARRLGGFVRGPSSSIMPR